MRFLEKAKKIAQAAAVLSVLVGVPKDTQALTVQEIETVYEKFPESEKAKLATVAELFDPKLDVKELMKYFRPEILQQVNLEKLMLVMEKLDKKNLSDIKMKLIFMLPNILLEEDFLDFLNQELYSRQFDNLSVYFANLTASLENSQYELDDLNRGMVFTLKKYYFWKYGEEALRNPSLIPLILVREYEKTKGAFGFFQDFQVAENYTTEVENKIRKSEFIDGGENQKYMFVGYLVSKMISTYWSTKEDRDARQEIYLKLFSNESLQSGLLDKVFGTKEERLAGLLEFVEIEKKYGGIGMGLYDLFDNREILTGFLKSLGDEDIRLNFLKTAYDLSKLEENHGLPPYELFKIFLELSGSKKTETKIHIINYVHKSMMDPFAMQEHKDEAEKFIESLE